MNEHFYSDELSAKLAEMIELYVFEEESPNKIVNRIRNFISDEIVKDPNNKKELLYIEDRALKRLDAELIKAY